MNALAQNPFFWVALIAGLLVLYVLPSVIGAIRKVEGLGWLIVVNLIPTGIGWLAAMVLAVILPRREPISPADLPLMYVASDQPPVTTDMLARAIKPVIALVHPGHAGRLRLCQIRGGSGESAGVGPR
jgi:hypothetical protein